MPSRRFEPPRSRPAQPRRYGDAKRDPGAYIGRLPERATETIPGGLGPKDERVSAVATQPAPVRGPLPAEADGRVEPEGHREDTIDRDDTLREAGQNR